MKRAIVRKKVYKEEKQKRHFSCLLQKKLSYFFGDKVGSLVAVVIHICTFIDKQRTSFSSSTSLLSKRYFSYLVELSLVDKHYINDTREWNLSKIVFCKWYDSAVVHRYIVKNVWYDLKVNCSKQMTNSHFFVELLKLQKSNNVLSCPL